MGKSKAEKKKMLKKSAKKKKKEGTAAGDEVKCLARAQADAAALTKHLRSLTAPVSGRDDIYNTIKGSESSIPAAAEAALRTIRRGSPAREFLVTALDVQALLGLIKHEHKVAEPLAALAKVVRDYKQVLQSAADEDFLDRMCESYRLRRIVDGINARTEELLKDLRQTSHISARLSELDSFNSESACVQAVFGTNLLRGMDAHACSFWERDLGAGVFWIEWDKFIESLATEIGVVMSDDMILALQSILDPWQSGWTNQMRLAGFMATFGPLISPSSGGTCLDVLRSIVREQWWLGFATKDEAEHLLIHEPDGSFLVRFSAAVPGDFALSFISGGRIYHVLVDATCPGFDVTQRHAGLKHFDNLHEVIAHHDHVLKRPFNNSLTRMEAFSGDVDGTEVQSLLAHFNIGTYLLRFSSSRAVGSLAISYVNSERMVSNWLVDRLDDGRVQLASGGQRFSCLSELIAALSDSLRAPITPPLGQSEAVVKIFRRWKQDFERVGDVVETIWRPFLGETEEQHQSSGPV